MFRNDRFLTRKVSFDSKGVLSVENEVDGSNSISGSYPGRIDQHRAAIKGGSPNYEYGRDRTRGHQDYGPEHDCAPKVW